LVFIYEVDILGFPTGSTISSGSFSSDDVDDTAPKFINVSMTSVTLKKSTKYAIVIQSGTTGGLLQWRTDNTGPSYAGGTAITSADSGATWSNEAEDNIFAVVGGGYDGTLCSLADAVNKAGANASSSSTNESLVSDFVKQSEGVICSITRHNWIDSYSGLNDDVKFLLNQVTSDLAAIYIITYDMSGYTDRVEAETMINVYRESATRGMSLLKNQEVKDFIVDA